MSRGHILASRNFPAGPQEKALADAGVKILYRGQIDKATASLRKGEPLWVHTLRGLGSSRRAIEAAVDAIHERGAHALDATTRWRSDGPQGHKLMSQAVASLSAERQGGHKGAQKNGAAGGIASGKAKAKGRMPWANIERLWFNKAVGRDELLERVNDSGYKPISYSAMHKHFGKRGVAVGRRAQGQ